MCRNQGTDFTVGEAMFTLLSYHMFTNSEVASLILTRHTRQELLEFYSEASALLAAQVDIAMSIL